MSGLRLLATFAVGAVAALAQNAALSGLILDPSALKVAGANVTVRNEQTGGRRATTSNEAGYFSVPSLNPGVYRISVHVTGFETMIREGVKLDVGENARLDFTLRIGDSRTEITVHGGPPLINMDDASVGTVIDRDIIDQMPLNGRGIQSLIELTPGVVVVPVVDSSRGQFSVNGQRSDGNYFTVDDADANFAAGNAFSSTGRGISTPPSIGQAGGGMLPANNGLGTFSNLVSPDALQEFKIQTSTFAPEFGRAPGAQVGLISRSGTNRYSGSLFEYFRNDKTDANDWFANQHGLKKAPLRFDNFGGAFGGPVRIPHVYNGHDRTFFFLSVDQLRMVQPQSPVTIYVPSLHSRQNTPAPAAYLMNIYPLPTNSVAGTTDFGQFNGSYSFRTEQHSYGMRLDHSFTDNLMFFARYNHAPSQTMAPVATLLTNPETSAVGTDTLTLGLTHSITPNLLNEFRLNGSSQTAGLSAQLEGAGGAASPPDSLLFAPGYSSKDSEAVIFPNLIGPTLMVGLLAEFKARQVQLRDNISFTRGAHQFRFGADYRWFSPVQIQPRSDTILIFLGLTGAAFSNVVPSAQVVTIDGSRSAYIVQAFSAFAQDTWKITSRITLTYGIRWEVNPAPESTSGPVNVLVGLSDLTNPSSGHLANAREPFYATAWSNIAPRFGMAWKLRDLEGRQTVLRVGGGRFFDLAQGGLESQGISVRNSAGYTDQPLGSFGVGSPGYVSTIDFTGTAVTAVAPGYRVPRIYQWNATVEQSFGKQTFSAGYIGALGRSLVNYARLPNPGPYTFIDAVGSNASSSYNAMQLQFNRRLPSQARLLVSYTWAHSIDTLSNDLAGQGNIDVPSLADYYNPGLNRGPSDFDIRHSLNGALIVPLPSPHRGVAALFFRNWSASSIFFARSAPPTNVLSSSQTTRPDLVPGQPLYLYGAGYPGGKIDNAAAFSDPPAGMRGGLGRNALRGFGAWQVDFALHRSFRMSEHASLQFRAEAFNVLNHPNFANPTNPGDASSPNQLSLGQPGKFGVSSAMLATGLGPQAILGQLNPLFQIGGPRSIQFALRLTF